MYVPLIARNLLQSIALLTSASRLLAEKCVDGIEANREQLERLRSSRSRLRPRSTRTSATTRARRS